MDIVLIADGFQTFANIVIVNLTYANLVLRDTFFQGMATIIIALGKGCHFATNTLRMNSSF
jgi:hypothetical protein